MLKNMKKMYLLGLSLLAFSFLFGSLSLGEQKVDYIPSKKECFNGQGPLSWKYCIHIPNSGATNGDVAYLLHGLNLSEQTWNDDTFYTAMIQDYWQKKNIVPPIVVTVSFGPSWLLTEKGQKLKSGLLDFFTGYIINEIEKKTGAPKRRIVFGESMGGLNSLQLGLKTSGLFQKVASSCPPVYKISPFVSKDKLQEFLKRTGADPQIINKVIQLANEFIFDENEWKKFSPLHLIENLDPKTAPEFYLSCGLYDAYGNFEGNEALQKRARQLGFKWTWRPIYGGHCATDVVSLADFLVQ